METQKYYREVLKKLKDLEVSMENISSGDQDPLLIVSQTEPTNPSDGLLWYKPDLYLTTTTTTCIGEYIDAPAPENVTITPDAVGSNPVTWYYRASYAIGNPLPTNRSLFTDEGSFIVGDSTTEIIVAGGVIPYWATVMGVILGTMSGNYPYIGPLGITSFPEDIFGNYVDPGYGNLYPLMLTIPIHQDWNGCGDEPTTTTTTTTTTTEEHLCEPLFYNGTMTVGVSGEDCGYNVDLHIGSINPLENRLRQLYYHTGLGFLRLIMDAELCYDSASIWINHVLYEVPMVLHDDIILWFQLENVLANPFPGIGETCNIQICFGDECTTTTTTQPI